MCVTWCLVVFSGRGAVGCQFSALGRVLVQGETDPNPGGAWVLFVCVCVFIPTGFLLCRPLCLVLPLVAQQRHRADSTLTLG